MYTNDEYAKKIRQSRIIYYMIQKPIMISLISRTLWLLGKDTEETQVKYMRGFPPSDEPYLLKFRKKPCAPLIKAIIDRTKNYTKK